MNNAPKWKWRFFFHVVGGTLTLSFLGIAARAQSLGTGEPIDPPIGRLILGLILCVIMIFIVVWILKIAKNRNARMSFKSFFDPTLLNTSPRIKILETRRLNQVNDACLFECDDTEYLVILSSNQALVLRERPVNSTSNSSETA